MQWSAITTLFLLTATTLGAPVASTTAELAIAPELRDQGDGFYIATFNDAGEVNVTFTPMAELITRGPAPVPANPVARDTDTSLSGPTKTTCTGHSNSVADLDAANVQLANNAPNYYIDKAWGWVHINGQTSFWCNYERNFLTHNLVIDMHIHISNECEGSVGYGHSQRTNQGNIRNLVVGRTFTGDHFCTKNFYGRRSILAPEPWTVATDVMDQGNGFYLATFNEVGEASVKFTPAAELPLVAPMTENLAAKSFKTLRKRDGLECAGRSSKNLNDLDWSNVQLARNAEGQHYEPNSWGWVHSNAETSYFCPYRAWKGSFDKIISEHTTISSGCRDNAAYGYNHHAARNEADDNLAVGRTFKGDHFCTKSFHGKQLARSIEQAEQPAEVSSLPIASNLMFQGDGLYIATFNNETGEADVEFTPEVQLNNTARAQAPVTRDFAAQFHQQTCSGRSSTNIADLDWANVELAKAGDGLDFYKHKQGWVHHNGETSFWCAYTNGWPDWHNKYNDFIATQVKISAHCGGSAAYGYDLYVEDWAGGQVKISIGRTFYGDNFCYPRFAPPSPANASTLEASRRSTAFDPRDQGDGFYMETVNGAGERTINFTPIAEFMPVELAQAPVTENVVAKSIDTLHRRDHYSQTCSTTMSNISAHVADLDYANVGLAFNVDGHRFPTPAIFWVKWKTELSYMCVYNSWVGSYKEVIEAHIRISNACTGGSAAYGYDHDDTIDMSLGRTFTGDGFC